MFQPDGHVAVVGQRRVESQTFRRDPGSGGAGCVQTVEVTCWGHDFRGGLIVAKYREYLVRRVSEVERELVGGVTREVNFSDHTCMFAGDFNGH